MSESRGKKEWRVFILQREFLICSRDGVLQRIRRSGFISILFFLAKIASWYGNVLTFYNNYDDL